MKQDEERLEVLMTPVSPETLRRKEESGDLAHGRVMTEHAQGPRVHLQCHAHRPSGSI